MEKTKIMWLAIFAFSIALGIASILYLAHKIGKCGLLIALAAAVVCILVFDVTNTIVIVIHFTVFLLLGDLVSLVVKTASHKDIFRASAVVSAVLCVIYLVIGWILMHGLWETDYLVGTRKEVGGLKIAQIADSHVGCGFSGKGFGSRLEKIAAGNPDILVITGDFVDDDTSKEDMLAACAALGIFNTKYGIYFCFGNHDAGYYSNERRGYGIEELTAELERNGVTVLQDESVLIDDRFYVIGRRDAGYGTSDRITAGDLVKDIDKDKYMIVLDHQPTDYDAEEAAGVDLVLSGHTHGGQIFPLEFVQPLVSQNDNVRGLDRRGNTDFIVTDGISDWAIKFRTGCKSEYNIIDIDGPAS